MKISSIILSVMLICFLSACQNNFETDVDFLKGTWKVENKEQYEVWKYCGKNELKGYSYKIVDKKEHFLETLSIKKEETQIIYSATVPNQNEGETIPFTLNTEIKDYLSFENPEHDFPKKIQYKKISDRELLVEVLGDKDEGFSFKMFKQL